DEAPREVAVAARPGDVAAGRDAVGADQAQERAASAERDVAVTAMAADARHLQSRLIEDHVVGLIGMGVGVVSGDCDVYRIVDREGHVNDAAVKISVAAVAGVIIPAHIVDDPVGKAGRTRSGNRMVQRPEGHVAAERAVAPPAMPAPPPRLEPTTV